jgi:ankyrin repeat protein
MAIRIPLSLWLVVLTVVTQIHGDTYPQIQKDVGDNPDTNTAPLLTDLNNGVSPDTIGPNGWTALHIAAGLDKPNMAKILKQKGANLNIQDSSSYTPLHVAAGLDRLGVISKLLPGANLEIKGPNQWTALHVAAGNGFADAIIALLINSANVNAADSNGWTPLHIAVGKNHLPAVVALLTKPAT